MIHQALHLGVLGHVRLQNGVITQLKLFGERPKPVDTPGSQHQFCAVLGEMTGSGFSQSAAGSGDDHHCP
jgi:hypothetical protein